MNTRIQAQPTGRAAPLTMGADGPCPVSGPHFLPAGVGPQRKLLDMAHAVDYVGDRAQALELLRMLDDTLQIDIPSLRRLVGRGDLPGAQRVLHALKSFVPIFCGPELVDQVAQAEALSKQGDCAALQAAWAALEPTLQALRVQICGQLA